MVDPDWETADTDVTNNSFPRQIIPTRVEAYRSQRSGSYARRDIMHDSTTELDTGDDEADPGEAEETAAAGDSQ